MSDNLVREQRRERERRRTIENPKRSISLNPTCYILCPRQRSTLLLSASSATLCSCRLREERQRRLTLINSTTSSAISPTSYPSPSFPAGKKDPPIPLLSNINTTSPGQSLISSCQTKKRGESDGHNIPGRERERESARGSQSTSPTADSLFIPRPSLSAPVILPSAAAVPPLPQNSRPSKKTGIPLLLPSPVPPWAYTSNK